MTYFFKNQLNLSIKDLSKKIEEYEKMNGNSNTTIIQLQVNIKLNESFEVLHGCPTRLKRLQEK